MGKQHGLLQPGASWDPTDIHALQEQPSRDHDLELLSPDGEVLTLAAKDPVRTQHAAD